MRTDRYGDANSRFSQFCQKAQQQKRRTGLKRIEEYKHEAKPFDLILPNM